eukprot:scaffold25492_cov140-Isochrysis_galbana.AAC.5
MMTDPPTDDTEAREPDPTDPTDAKPHAPLHGHTGGVPSDKALSDTAEILRLLHAKTPTSCCRSCPSQSARSAPWL